MRKPHYYFLLLGLVSATSAFNLPSSENIVMSFYDNLKILSNGKEGDDSSYEASASCINMSERNLQRFPNEFKILKVEDSHSDTNLICESYIYFFKKLAATNRMQFSYHIKSSIPYCEPEWGKSNKEVTFCYYIVEKSYGSSIYSKSIIDTVFVNTKNDKIIGIRNFAGGDACTGHISTVSNNTSISISPNANVNLEDLHIAASKYYTQKRYTEAFNTYQNILTRDSTNANAYYRLAIMSYRRKGCKHFSKKETDKMAMTYINNAYANGDSQLRYKIKNILYYWR